MLDLLKLKTFQAVAATKNFTRAAAELGYSQSSVTTHIQALERELGALLFDRLSPRRVVLTDVGRRTLEYATRLLALAEEAKTAIHSQTELRGAFSVSAPEALLVYRLPDVLRRFQTLYPNVQLTLTSHSDCQSQIDAILEEALDLAFVVDERLLSGQLTFTASPFRYNTFRFSVGPFVGRIAQFARYLPQGFTYVPKQREQDSDRQSHRL